MIRLVCFVRRRPDLDPAAFRRHWREKHGPLIASLRDLSRHVLRYEQNHPIEGPDGATGDYDGATIMEFASMAAYHAFATDPLYASEVAPDEARFMDRSKTTYFFARPPEVKFDDRAPSAKPPGLKLLALLARRQDVPSRTFHDHWSGPHAALFRDTPELRESILAYQQSHRMEGDLERDPATPWEGLAEQWYASLEDFRSGAGGPPFERVVVPDEERFIDRDATRFLLCEPEIEILPGR